MGLRGNAGSRGMANRAISGLGVAKHATAPPPPPPGLKDLAGITIHYDASDPTAVVHAIDPTSHLDQASQWTDGTSLHHDSTQATTSAKPLWVPAAQNGLGLVRFAAGQRLVIDPAITAATSFTVFLVWKNSGADSAQHGGFYLKPNLLINSAWNATNQWGSFRNAGYNSSGSVISGLTACCFHQVNSATWTYYTGSAGTPLAVTTGPIPFTGLSMSMLGADEFGQSFLGDFAELGYITPALDPSLIVPNLVLLETKWGL